MAYTVKLRPAARRQIDRLKQDPRPPGSMQLQAEEKLFRVQAGPRNAYRIVYQILDQESVVLVAKIGHRSEVYRRLP